MSSIVGHCSVGIAAYLSSNRVDDRRSLWAFAILVFVCVCPDFDYIIFWAFRTHFSPRFTHSLAFGAVIGGVCWAASSRSRREIPQALPLHALFVAAISHPLLDLLVGVHPVPIFWPFVSYEPSLPFGILPSAGLLKLANPVLWRNLLIECGVLFPLLALWVGIARGFSVRSLVRHAMYVVPAWVIFVAWSVSLAR